MGRLAPTMRLSRVANNPPINQAGNIIRVGEGSDDFMRHVAIDYDITTPANTMLAAESGSGDLQLSNLNGTVQAHTGSGSIRADKLGSGSKLETGSGSIEATNLWVPLRYKPAQAMCAPSLDRRATWLRAPAPVPSS